MTAKSCDTCRAPGSCCYRFPLTVNFNIRYWKEEATRLLEEHNWPHIVPVSPWPPLLASEVGAHGGRTQVLFSCIKLTSEGRCGDYENRPEFCASFEVADDGLCAEYQPVFRGIPVVHVPTGT